MRQYLIGALLSLDNHELFGRPLYCDRLLQRGIFFCSLSDCRGIYYVLLLLPLVCRACRLWQRFYLTSNERWI